MVDTAKDLINEALSKPTFSAETVETAYVEPQLSLRSQRALRQTSYLLRTDLRLQIVAYWTLRAEMALWNTKKPITGSAS